MIKINSIQYSDYKIEVTWKKFNIISNDKKILGKAPYITFYINKDIIIELELTFSYTMLSNTKINVKTDIKEYISDINFKNDNSWSSLISTNYDCNIIRMNEKIFNLDFSIKDDETNIFINTNIELF